MEIEDNAPESIEMHIEPYYSPVHPLKFYEDE